MSTDAATRWVRTPLSAEQRSRSLARLTDAERDREPTDAFLAGRLLLRELAGDIAITAGCPECGREHGQPRLGDARFASISHAGDLTVVAVADVPVGIDAEPDDADVPAMFARDVAGWTAIEAVLKADGRGLRVDPAEVQFEPAEARDTLRPWSLRTPAVAGTVPDVRTDHARRSGVRTDHARASVGGVDYEVRWVETAPGFTTAVARAVR